MDFSDSDLEQFMSYIGQDEASNLRYLLAVADISGEFEGDDQWAQLCDFIVRRDASARASLPFWQRYDDAARVKGADGVYSALWADMYDNYALAAVCAHEAGLEKSWPLIAWAGFNKHTYEGLKAEFGVIRFLEWSGFDLNAPETQTGNTALHYLAQVKYAPHSHTRAVRWLIDHGADVNARNARGDTPLIVLSGSSLWSSAMTDSFLLLMTAGANPFDEADDGNSAYAVLMDVEKQFPDPKRQRLIASIAKALSSDAMKAMEAKTPQSIDLESAAASAAFDEGGSDSAQDQKIAHSLSGGEAGLSSMPPTGPNVEATEIKAGAAESFAERAGFFTKLLHKHTSPKYQKDIEAHWRNRKRNAAGEAQD